VPGFSVLGCGTSDHPQCYAGLGRGGASSAGGADGSGEATAMGDAVEASAGTAGVRVGTVDWDNDGRERYDRRECGVGAGVCELMAMCATATCFHLVANTPLGVTLFANVAKIYRLTVKRQQTLVYTSTVPRAHARRTDHGALSGVWRRA
jgi:hypothetical protein